ncbi:MAG: permease [Nitrospinae bacterium]|nr:permease [Nitrospinota bacterium]
MEVVMDNLLDVGREFGVLTVTVFPYFFLGIATGAAFAAFLPERRLLFLSSETNGFRSLTAAIAAAALLPGCSCATMPMAAGLKRAFAPRLGVVAAFIFMSPLLSPVTVALTWAVLGWRMTVARVLASFVGSYLLGFIVNYFEDWFVRDARLVTSSPFAVVEEDARASSACSPAADLSGERSKAARFWREFKAIFRSVTPYFLLGMAIAALLSALLPEDAIPQYLGGASGTAAYSLAALVGIPIYVCEGEEVPITYALIARGLGAGPALTFLLGSLGTCIPTILMARNIIGLRATRFYVVFWLVFAVGSGLLFQLAMS